MSTAFPWNARAATVITCKFNGVVNPYERIAIPIKVKVNSRRARWRHCLHEATVEGGGGGTGLREACRSKSAASQHRFGVSTYELGPFNEDGSPAIQAGAHPFQLTTTLMLNQAAGGTAVALPKDLSFRLPPGLIGNPTAAAQCTISDFISLV